MRSEQAADARKSSGRQVVLGGLRGNAHFIDLPLGDWRVPLTVARCPGLPIMWAAWQRASESPAARALGPLDQRLGRRGRRIDGTAGRRSPTWVLSWLVPRHVGVLCVVLCEV